MRQIENQFHQFGEVSHLERVWVLKVSMAVLLLTSLPYLLGYALQGETYRFTGFIFAVEDGNSYIAKMFSGANGAWLFRTPYTAMQQSGVLLFFPYILLGKLASSPGMHEQLVVLFHTFRLIAGMFLFMATYDFLAFFLKSQQLRRFGLLLIALGGGLGWLLLVGGKHVAFGVLPLEFFSPETFGFLSLYGVPHLAAARALLLWTVLSYLKFIYDPDLSLLEYGFKTGLLWMMASLMQPLSGILISLVLALHIIVWWIERYCSSRKTKSTNWQEWYRGFAFVLWSGILPGFLTLYLALKLKLDAYLQAWNNQNILPSPHPVYYLLAFSLVLPYAILGARRLLIGQKTSALLVVSWSLVLPLLAYFPVNVQRRLPEGQWVVWGVLALAAIDGWLGKTQLQSRARRFLVLAPLCLGYISPLLLFVGGFMTVQARSEPVFRERDEVALFELLARRSEPDCLVVADFKTGNALPAWAAVNVVIGHGPESAELPLFTQQVHRFYSSSTSDLWREEWLSQLNVCYVFWGPAEQSSGTWDPSQARYLVPEENRGAYWLFKVKLEP